MALTSISIAKGNVFVGKKEIRVCHHPLVEECPSSIEFVELHTNFFDVLSIFHDCSVFLTNLSLFLAISHYFSVFTILILFIIYPGGSR